MAEGVISDLAAKALASLAELAFRKVVSWWGARDDLKKLENTMAFIHARVRDAERRQEGETSDTIKLWLRKLKQVLYRADDLFEIVLTLDPQNPRVEKSTLAKVGILFSKPVTSVKSNRKLANEIWSIRKLANEIWSIRKELDEIKSNMDGLYLTANHVVGQPSPMQLLLKKRQTASFVKAEDVIGRENDKNIIIGMLFDPSYDDEKQITVIPIVGFGGLGKTTLAQLIFNDDVVRNHFDLTKWVCVPEVGDRHTVMRRIYQSFTGDKDSDKLLESQIVTGIQQSVMNKKYLLVLDDIWDENREIWSYLLKLLECGESGSRVIVTTRSAIVAKVVGTTEAYNLKFLTNEESWTLFKKIAFQSKQDESNLNLTRIGLEIVDTCTNVPLTIIVVGSLLYCKNSEEHWRRIRDARLSKAKGKEDDSIMQALKLSYDYLPPRLKQCFAYCSLFPKDYEYYKKDLVKLWMAQGYIDPSSTDNGEEYFMELLGRNLFQDPKEDDYGIVGWCKMHDLVHDLAQRVAGEEIKQLGEPSSQQVYFDEVIHVSVEIKKDQWEALESFDARNLRSLIMLSPFQSKLKESFLEMMLLKFQSLRTLVLVETNISMVPPNCIGKLRHLRFLSLEWNHGFECLPDDITKLENLQTLNLFLCASLKELPRDICKLSNLRHLSIGGCFDLIDLPLGFGELKSLRELDVFIVGKNNGIDSLPALNLIGDLEIKFSKRESDIVVEAQRAKLKDNQQLNCLKLSFSRDFGETNEMLECLQLPPNLRKFDIEGYKGVEMPRRWLDGLSKLVDINISGDRNCRVLPRMSQLPHLKKLNLRCLGSLEYIEDEDGIQMGDGDEKHNDYFPSLESLQLWSLKSLKGWARPSKDDDDGEPRQLRFPCLLHLKYDSCPKLMSMPLAPKLKSLVADVINWKLLVSNPTSIDCEESSSSASSSATLFPSLKELQIQIIKDTTSINLEDVFQSIACITTLQTLKINMGLFSSFIHASDLKQLPEEMSKLSLLRELVINQCPKLASLPQSLLDLPSLQTLKLWDCQELKERYEKPNGPDCLLLQHIPIVEFDNDFLINKDDLCCCKLLSFILAEFTLLSYSTTLPKY